MTDAPYSPPPQQPRRRGGLIALAIVGGVLVLGLGGCLAIVASIGNGAEDTTVAAGPAATEPGDSDTGSIDNADKPAGAPYNIKVTKCARAEYGSFDVVVKITNNTEDETDYFFDIGLYDPKDNTVGSGFGSIEVLPGKSGTTTTFASLDDDDYKGKVRCKVKVTDF